MAHKQDYDTSYRLERELAKSIEKVAENITKQHKIRKDILKLRKQRKQIESVPDEVREWFEETGEEVDE